MYVLPLNSRSALVEYTFFGSTLWEAQVYEAELKTYIEKKYGTGYRIVHTETGKIPMQQGVFTPTGPCGEINIGTLGGMVKAGTGYAFRRMRRDSEALAEAWFTNNSPQRAASNRRFSWYDSLLLWIIRYHPEACKNIFTKLFAGQKMEQVIRFMDEETKLHEELFIISSLPKRIFLQALFARPKSVDQPIAGREPVLSPT
jgi:lycopene beta-cyclase